MPTKWLYRELFRSDERDAIDVDGLVFRSDGITAISGDRWFQRRQAVDYEIGGCRFFRQAGSDMLRVTQTVSGVEKSTYFWYEHGPIDRVYEVIPDAAVPADNMPPEPRQTWDVVVTISRMMAAFLEGFGNKS